MVYRVFITKEVTLDADSWEEACEKALDGDDFIQIDEYLDDERNETEEGADNDCLLLRRWFRPV